MEIDDVGGSPVRLAEAITKQLPDLSKPVPVREIAKAIDIYHIREEPLDGLEGGLVFSDDKAQGAILVHRDRPEARKRYTIAHEIGHYVNPFHRSDSLRCAERDLAADHHPTVERAKEMEVQANQFAAELLMPRQQVDKFLGDTTGADIRHILGMVERFDVSKEASARRYVARMWQPLAVVFSKEGRIRYVKSNDDFPRLGVWSGYLLPAGSLSLASKASVGRVSDWLKVDSAVWLEYGYRRGVWEQTLAQKNGFRMTLLKVEEEGKIKKTLAIGGRRDFPDE